MALFTWDKRNENHLLEMSLAPAFGDPKDGSANDVGSSPHHPASNEESSTSASWSAVAVADQECDAPDGQVVRLPNRTLALPTQTHRYRVVKRLCDLALSILMLPVLGIMLFVIGVTVAVTSGFPVFYRQHRLGQHGKTFRIFKFRTMRNNADQALAEWLLHHPELRQEWQRTHKLRRDPRITRLGRFLRDTSLDEIPQIINVLRGEMSLVGPRPIVQAERSRYAGRYGYYSAAVPGITGVWQVSGRCNVSYEDRVRMDEDYVRNWSLVRDFVILLRTPRSVIRRDGAC